MYGENNWRTHNGILYEQTQYRVQTSPVDEWVTEQREKEGLPAQDVRRAVRNLASKGRLVKPRRGIFKYVPDQDKERELQDFSQAVKQAILKKYNYRCIVRGQGKEDGVDIAVDHKTPREKGGTNDIENGQILCTAIGNSGHSLNQDCGIGQST